MFNPFEIHHLYWGILLIIGGVYLNKKRPDKKWWVYVLIMLGSILAADDICEHFLFQGWSPLNALFHIIWRYTGGPICQWLFGNSWPFPF